MQRAASQITSDDDDDDDDATFDAEFSDFGDDELLKLSWQSWHYLKIGILNKNQFSLKMGLVLGLVGLVVWAIYFSPSFRESY